MKLTKEEKVKIKEIVEKCRKKLLAETYFDPEFIDKVCKETEKRLRKTGLLKEKEETPEDWLPKHLTHIHSSMDIHVKLRNRI